MNGYTGKILKVDLTTGTFEVEEQPESFYRRYMGGSGMVGYYLNKEIPKGADPLGPENVLVFAGGPMTGVPIGGSGRNAVGAKAPLTGGYGEADAGGFFGAEMRRAGFDAIVVRGAAATPVYLWVHDGEYELRPADHLWGTMTFDCQTKVREELGDARVRLSMIGPGGEKLIRFACVINDVKHAAGRTGLGAVMGSKNLKAIAARGTATPPLANQDGVRDLARWMAQNWKDRALGMHELGTNGGLEGLSEGGRLPTRNFQDGKFEGAAEIGGQALRDKITIEMGGCYACPINCKRVCKVDDEDYKVDPAYGGPEYETVGAFGSNCGVDDIRAVAVANELCNAYGVDTISTGMMVSFAMECYENGLLTKQETGGLDLSFGNAKEMVELTRMICEREGIGDLLAEGPRAAVRKIGPASKPYAIEVKNQPYPMHECRTRHGQALGYAVSPTGADHMHNLWDGGLANNPPGEGLQAFGNYESVPETVLDAQKVRAYTATANWSWFGNALGCCAFLPWSNDQKVELVRTITGWKTDIRELSRIGERSVTLARVFNMREGLGRETDILPGRMNTFHVTQTINEKPVDPEVLDEAVSIFYGMMGWDPQTGAPTDGKLHDLDIAWVKDYQ